jgi:hypothetical protein
MKATMRVAKTEYGEIEPAAETVADAEELAELAELEAEDLEDEELEAEEALTELEVEARFVEVVPLVALMLV